MGGMGGEMNNIDLPVFGRIHIDQVIDRVSTTRAYDGAVSSYAGYDGGAEQENLHP